MIKDLGGTPITDIEKNLDVFVAKELIRNAKLLYAINKGAKIVSLKWITDSKKEGKFLDTEDYILSDKKFEQKYSLKLNDLYNNKGTGNLMKGHSFYVSDNIKSISSEHMKALITSAGGIIVPE